MENTTANENNHKMPDKLHFGQKIAKGLAKVRGMVDNKTTIKIKENLQCQMCFKDTQYICITNCGHSFCKICIAMWLADCETCPSDCECHTKITKLYNVEIETETP